MTKKKENDRVVKFLIFPLLAISFLGSFIVPDLFAPLLLYAVMNLWSLNAYKRREYQEEIYGIKRKGFGLIKVAIIGIVVGGGFLILTAISPAFSLLTPAISLAVAENIRFFVIVGIAPVAEEIWRSSTFGYLRENYKKLKQKFWKSNFLVAILFAALHLFSYGILFNSYDKWIEVYGVFLAIFGSLFAAFSFGLVSGFMMHKFKSIIPSIFAHFSINLWLVKSGLIVVG